MSLEYAPTVDRVRIRVLPDGRVNRRDSATYLGVSVKTLAMWLTQGKGPASVLVGGRRFSYISELDRYIAEGDERSTPVSEPEPEPAGVAA